MVDRGKEVRFEATIHPGDADVPLESVTDLDLDRVPDPQRGVRLLVTTEEILALLERGYEVRLHRPPGRAASPELRSDDDDAVPWLEERVQGIPREEGCPDVPHRRPARLDFAPLAAWFPAYFTRIALPEPSVQGRPVYPLRLRVGGGGERRGVMVVGGTHSRELMNPDAIIELAIDLFISRVNRQRRHVWESHLVRR